MPFDHSVALVTGAASGIGRALALELDRRGARVCACDIDEAGLQGLAADATGHIQVQRLDVTDEAAVAGVFEAQRQAHGRLDFVFNNAGIVVGGDFEQMDPATWRRIVDINFWGVVYGSQQAYRIMREQGHGHIVNTASTAGLTPVARSTAYAATKHAVVGLSTSLREEGRAHGVRVSVAVPGLVDTAIFGRAVNLAGHDYDAAIRRLPIRKISPAQAADAMLAGVAANRQFIVFPGYNRLIVALNRLAPGLMGWLINRDASAKGQ